MSESFGSRPVMCFEVEKVIGVSSDGNYQVQWAPAWVSKFHLVGCEHLIKEFLQQQQQQPQQQKQRHQQRQQQQQQQQRQQERQQSHSLPTECNLVVPIDLSNTSTDIPPYESTSNINDSDEPEDFTGSNTPLIDSSMEETYMGEERHETLENSYEEPPVVAEHVTIIKIENEQFEQAEEYSSSTWFNEELEGVVTDDTTTTFTARTPLDQQPTVAHYSGTHTNQNSGMFINNTTTTNNNNNNNTTTTNATNTTTTTSL